MEQIIKKVNVSTLRDDLALALRKVEHGNLCYVVHRHNRSVAALVSMETIRKFWDAEDVYDPDKKDPPEPEPEPEVHGYFRRLFSRRKRGADRRARQGESESASDTWAYMNCRGLDESV